MEWINIKEKFPPYNTEVLVLDSDHKIWQAEYDCSEGRIGWWYDHSFEIDNATHWMPLPKLPHAMD